jgi:hypothetical protein
MYHVMPVIIYPVVLAFYVQQDTIAQAEQQQDKHVPEQHNIRMQPGSPHAKMSAQDIINQVIQHKRYARQVIKVGSGHQIKQVVNLPIVPVEHTGMEHRHPARHAPLEIIVLVFPVSHTEQEPQQPVYRPV